MRGTTRTATQSGGSALRILIIITSLPDHAVLILESQEENSFNDEMNMDEIGSRAPKMEQFWSG